MRGGHHTQLDSRDIVADFFPRFEEEIDSSWVPAVGMTIDSDRAIEDYKWPGAAQGMRKWQGGRQANELNKFSMQIENEQYEASMAIPLKDLRRDKTGFLRRRVRDQARKAANHWRELVSSAIDDNGKSYDGKNFFASDHDESGSNQTNDLTNTEVPAADVANVSAPTPEEMADIILQAIAHMYTLKDDKDDPVNGNLSRFLIMTEDPAYWAAARKAISAAQLAQGESNVLTDAEFQLEVAYNVRLTSQASNNRFLIFAQDGDLAPFILQEEVPLQTKLLAEGSDYEHMNDAHLFSVDATRAVGYGRWHHAARVTLN